MLLPCASLTIYQNFQECNKLFGNYAVKKKGHFKTEPLCMFSLSCGNRDILNEVPAHVTRFELPSCFNYMHKIDIMHYTSSYYIRFIILAINKKTIWRIE